MSHRIDRSFFAAKELLFVGYSRRNEAFSRGVKEAFERAGATVYPVNPKGGPAGLEVYRSVESVPASPELAYVLTNKSNSAAVVDALKAKGVKRVLFQSKMSVDEATLARCAELGLQTAVACPMMALGKGFHRFHGFLAGVRG